MSYSEPNRSQTIHAFIVNKSHFFLRESGWKRLFPPESQITFTAWALSLVMSEIQIYSDLSCCQVSAYTQKTIDQRVYDDIGL